MRNFSQCVASNRKTGIEKRRIMVFDLDFDGHHVDYIQYLIEYWCRQKLPGILYLVVSSKFVQERSNVAQLAREAQQHNVYLVPITPKEQNNLRSKKSLLERKLRNLQEFNLLCKYARKLQVAHCIVMYLDTFFLSLVWGVKPLCYFSGIYFRPTFHYGELTEDSTSWQDKLQQWREKFSLSRIFQQKLFKTLFCLDPLAIKHLNRFSPRTKVVYLPDPVQIYPQSVSTLENLRKDLTIESHRQVFLLFGALTQRKGIVQLLEAISMLPFALCQQISLLLVGPLGTNAEEKIQMQTLIAESSRSFPIQIVVRDQFIQDRNIQPYFTISDVILCPYQRHVGMSAILVRAAAARKPVLAQNYGLMGEITRRYQLGLTVDSTIPKEIAKGLSQVLQESPEQLCNFEQMKIFTEQNSAENFARTIFQHI